jgi:hypothetical protein
MLLMLVFAWKFRLCCFPLWSQAYVFDEENSELVLRDSSGAATRVNHPGFAREVLLGWLNPWMCEFCMEVIDIAYRKHVLHSKTFELVESITQNEKELALFGVHRETIKLAKLAMDRQLVSQLQLERRVLHESLSMIKKAHGAYTWYDEKSAEAGLGTPGPELYHGLRCVSVLYDGVEL